MRIRLPLTLLLTLLLVAFGGSLPGSAQTRKPDTDSESLIQTRAMRFSGEAPPYRLFVQYPWLAGEGQAIPVGQVNSVVARTVLDWVQQFSMQHARVETDPNWRERTAPARLDVVYRILRPTSRLLCVVYTRSINDGRAPDDLQTVRIDSFDFQAFRPLSMTDLMEGDRWLRPVGDHVEAALKAEAKRRGSTLFSSLVVREWLRDSARWQFEKSAATFHFRPGDAAPESAGRFEVIVPYALFTSSVRRNGALGPLVPKEERNGSGNDERPGGRTR